MLKIYRFSIIRILVVQWKYFYLSHVQVYFLFLFSHLFVCTKLVAKSIQATCFLNTKLTIIENNLLYSLRLLFNKLIVNIFNGFFLDNNNSFYWNIHSFIKAIRLNLIFYKFFFSYFVVIRDTSSDYDYHTQIRLITLVTGY